MLRGPLAGGPTTSPAASPALVEWRGSARKRILARAGAGRRRRDHVRQPHRRSGGTQRSVPDRSGQASCGTCSPAASPRRRSCPHRSARPRTGADVDFQVSFGNAFRWLRPTVDAFPRHGGFLVADPQRVAHWRARLAALGAGPVVGISGASRLVTHLRKAEFTELPGVGADFRHSWHPLRQSPVRRKPRGDRTGGKSCSASASTASTTRWTCSTTTGRRGRADGRLRRGGSAPTSVSAMAGALGVPCYRMTVPEDWTDLGQRRLGRSSQRRTGQAAPRRRLDAGDRRGGRAADKPSGGNRGLDRRQAAGMVSRNSGSRWVAKPSLNGVASPFFARCRQVGGIGRRRCDTSGHRAV